MVGKVRWQCGICDMVDFTDDNLLPEGWEYIMTGEDGETQILVCRHHPD